MKIESAIEVAGCRWQHFASTIRPIRRRRVIADWPGLGKNDLYEGSGLRATADIRSLLKGIPADHLQMPGGFLERSVFPDSSSAVAMQGLIKT